MENNQNKETNKPNVTKGMTSGQRVSFIWGPVLLKWGISLVVSMFAGVLIALQMFAKDSDKMMDLVNDQEAMLKVAQDLVMKNTTFIEGAAAIVTIAVMWFFFVRKDTKREQEFGIVPNRKAPTAKYWMPILISGMMSLALNNLILIANLSSYSEAYGQVSEALYSPGLVVQIVCLCILVPISEELVFRGIVYRRIRWESRPSIAIFYSAAIFAVVHGNLVQGIYGFLMGILLAYLYEKFGSVLAPIAAHMTANLITVLGSEYGVFQWEMADIRIIGVVTVVSAVLASIVYLQIKNMDEKPEMNAGNI